jgi:hypothetical protein
MRMVYLHIPTDPAVLASMGKVALLHSHLDHVLRRTIKTVADLTIRDGDDATRRLSSRELRSRVKRLAK